ncbi:hypothetical protein K435DRAFT_799545 [Dendrothele bispora CBS 962.96]|uniref:Uncharacterized protein n=1 Tax=Dendrothele bispora (strain CBS 962.96) TaxID=1314807 RepID=A0A4S8LVG7_DENBC|nr:hypothetical protein K435DRAFT_799545 [Dendrothele bispora CBS 962.96]
MGRVQVEPVRDEEVKEGETPVRVVVVEGGDVEVGRIRIRIVGKAGRRGARAGRVVGSVGGMGEMAVGDSVGGQVPRQKREGAHLVTFRTKGGLCVFAILSVGRAYEQRLLTDFYAWKEASEEGKWEAKSDEVETALWFLEPKTPKLERRTTICRQHL